MPCSRTCSRELGGSAAGAALGLRHGLSLAVLLFICGLQMTLSSQGCQSLAVINLSNALRPLNDTKEG